MRHVLEYGPGHQISAFSEKICNNRKACSKNINDKSVCLNNANYKTSHAKSCHCHKITKPGNTQKVCWNTDHLTANTDSHTSQKQKSFFALLYNCKNGFCGSYARRPCPFCRKHFAVKGFIKNCGINNGCQKRTDQHRVHQIHSSHNNRNTNGKKEAVCC